MHNGRVENIDVGEREQHTARLQNYDEYDDL